MHLIDSLEFDVALATEERAFKEQEQLQAFLRGPALRVIHSVFDEWSPPHEVWRLDRLELDLGVVAGNDLTALWEQRLREALHEQLMRLRQGPVAAPGQAGAAAASPAVALPAMASPDREQKVSPQVRAPSDLGALLHFLQHGVLPWHVVLPPGQRLADWASAVALGDTAALAQQLQRSPCRPLMVRRLAQQLPPAALCPLVQALGLPAAWPLASWVAAAAQRSSAAAGRNAAARAASPAQPEDGPGPAEVGAAAVVTVPRAAPGALQPATAAGATRPAPVVAATANAASRLEQALWACVLVQAVAAARQRPSADAMRAALRAAADAAGRHPSQHPHDHAQDHPHALPHAPPHGHPAERSLPGDFAALDATVRDRLRSDPARLHDWWLGVGGQGQTRQRLAASLSQPTWCALLELCAPAAASALQLLLRRQAFGSAWLRLSRRPWAQTVQPLREAVLGVLIDPDAVRMESDVLLSAVAERAAGSFHTTAEHVLAVLRVGIERTRLKPAAASVGFDILAGWLRLPQTRHAILTARAFPGHAAHTREEAAVDGVVSGAATVTAAGAVDSAVDNAVDSALDTAVDNAVDSPLPADAASVTTAAAATRGLSPTAWPRPHLPPQTLAAALQRCDAVAAWLAWQACEATDPTGAGAMLAALCRQPALRAELAAGLPAPRQLAMVRSVAPAAVPLLRALCGRRGRLFTATAATAAPTPTPTPTPTSAAATRDLRAGVGSGWSVGSVGSVWSAWWTAWAETADAATALRTFAAAMRQAHPASAPQAVLANPPHAAPRSLSTRPLPALVRQWQATAGPRPMPPALQHEWHQACATAGARAWLVAALPPAPLHALAARLAPSAAAMLAACIDAALWSAWPADPAAAWPLGGWWRLWLARWAAAPAEQTFDRSSALDAWFVHAARASGQALPDYLEGLLQRLQRLPAPARDAGAGPVVGATAEAAAAGGVTGFTRSFVLQRAQVGLTRSRLDSRFDSSSDSSSSSISQSRSVVRPVSHDTTRSRDSFKGPNSPRAVPAGLAAGADAAAPAHALGAPAAATTPARWRAAPAPNLPCGEAVTVANAGLVLLAGFAPRLFSTLGWLQERRLVDDETAGRAVHLLQWLVDERSDADEYELVLNKLLCGLPLATPVPCQVWLQAGECEVAQQMLQGVITHWSALGRTSLQGLRESFLQREGRLVREEAGWRLHVAPRAFDMLLDRLPWSFTMLKLPWMPEVLHVDWR